MTGMHNIESRTGLHRCALLEAWLHSCQNDRDRVAWKYRMRGKAGMRATEK